MDPSSNIYNVNEPPWAQKVPERKKRRRHPRIETFDEVVNKDLSATHRRRSRNSGFRRFRHRMKDREFSRKFWVISLGSVLLILFVLIVWDLFFRYPEKTPDSAPAPYRADVK